ncbi:conserved hypothetical protein [Rhodopseudomonas palustris HaA2]|uniref:Uncharacterized protein n=1 Tax=Rhodopseudomonas palustris (strain HaA2) TaxID=316058 RepID=Q2IV52_RHOP2|nr:hypothetical protein [Rhodopseudomonas palustris]ABD07908.1 conserved hypothetical protein [Rhodopseudomonas palustris HaA2]
MPLQNRVTPFGEIVAVASRGMFTGNRGIIHDPATKTLLTRRWSSPAWITCVCDFRGRRRDVMATRSWTELFFLDEATALAAGHRPCYFCRRADANAFAAAWAEGNGLARVTARQIDATLHAERLDGRATRLHPLPCAIEALPDGAMVAALAPDADGSRPGHDRADCYLIGRGEMLQWSFDGYRAVETPPRRPQLITPPSTLRALQAGYRPRCSGRRSEAAAD